MQQTCIESQVVFTGTERCYSSHASAGVRIAVAAISTDILLCKNITNRFDELDFIVAWYQINEVVITSVATSVVACYSSRDERTISFVQINGYAIHAAGSTIVLLAIIVGV